MFFSLVLGSQIEPGLIPHLFGINQPVREVILNERQETVPRRGQGVAPIWLVDIDTIAYNEGLRVYSNLLDRIRSDKNHQMCRAENNCFPSS